MPTYLYCLLSSGRATLPSELRGIDRAAVRVLSTPGLDAWVSDVDSTPVVPSIEKARAHDAVIAAALGAGVTPLPLRFGQTTPSDAVLERQLVTRAFDYERRLARIDGMVEMRVRTTLPSTTDPDENRVEPSSPGRDYLEQIRRASAPARRTAQVMHELEREILDAAGGIIRSHVLQVDQRQAGVGTLAHLVVRSDVERYRAAVSGVIENAEGTCTVIGPTAPYSFTDDR
jgi:hypothetical protein